MKAYIIDKWSTNEALNGTSLVSGQLIAQNDKYYFKRDSDGLNLSMNPPDGHITWSANAGPYELALLTSKGLVYTVSPPAGNSYSFLVAVVTE